MRTSIIFIALLFVFGNQLIAQELNSIVPGTAKNIPDGWHKFTFQGVRFDVGVEEEFLTEGNVVWFDSARYSGSFSGYDISGNGTYVWPNRERYEGKFKKNMRHGKGTMFYKDGTYFYGKWKNNKRNGKGQLYQKNGDLIKDGLWENDVFIKAAKPKKKEN